MRGLVAAVVLVCAVARAEDEAPAAASTLLVVSVPQGAVISIDGALMGLAPRTETLAPGVHTVTAELGDAQVQQTLTLAPGQQRTLTLRLAPAVVPRPFPTAGVLTSAGGAALLGVGLLLRIPAHEAGVRVSALYRQGGGWDQAASALESAGVSAQTWSWICTVAGAGVLASGLVVTALQLFGGLGSPPPLALLVSPQGAMLAWSGNW